MGRLGLVEESRANVRRCRALKLTRRSEQAFHNMLDDSILESTESC